MDFYHPNPTQFSKHDYLYYVTSTMYVFNTPKNMFYTCAYFRKIPFIQSNFPKSVFNIFGQKLYVSYST